MPYQRCTVVVNSLFQDKSYGAELNRSKMSFVFWQNSQIQYRLGIIAEPISLN